MSASEPKRPRWVHVLASAYELEPWQVIEDSATVATWTGTEQQLHANLGDRHQWDTSVPFHYVPALRREAALALAQRGAARRAVNEQVMIWRSGPDMGCTEFSQSWLAFTGRSLADQLGAGWAAGVHPDDLEQCLDIYQSAFAARRAFYMDYRLRRHDGEYRRILDIGTPEWDSQGRFVGYVGSCVDVTEAQRPEVTPAHPFGLEIAPRGRSIDRLTQREREVVALVARGLANREIGAELVISAATVRVHIEHILAKLALHSRAQVIAWMLSQQSLQPAPPIAPKAIAGVHKSAKSSEP